MLDREHGCNSEQTRQAAWCIIQGTAVPLCPLTPPTNTHRTNLQGEIVYYKNGNEQGRARGLRGRLYPFVGMDSATDSVKLLGGWHRAWPVCALGCERALPVRQCQSVAACCSHASCAHEHPQHRLAHQPSIMR